VTRADPTGQSEAPATPISRVLLVEDEDVLRVTYERVLRQAGFEVAAVSDGILALQAIEGPYDVIVSDIGLPGLSGLDLLRGVRAQHLDLPVILMTGAPSVETAVAAVEHGIFRYLSKPVKPEQLVDIVSRAVATGRLAAVKREAMRINGEGNPEGTGDNAGLQARFESALAGIWMAFQPIVSLRNGGVFGYEALLRTNEPTLVHPLHFLDAAQRLGSTHRLGRAIRAKVAEAAPSAPAHARLFVNVHAEELDDFELCSSAAPLSTMARRVVLEVTERHSLDSVRGLSARIAKLRELGFCLAVDDLGAGYAGLSSFSILEPEFVKLDMSLIRGVDGSRRKQSVIRSMVKLCERDLEMKVICEGVETPAECATLASLGADLVQGYLFARPSKGFVLL
jgi:EAL domain-containing protein (putative c-di-GMP-specific phosphodiesterase class I)